MLTLKKDLLNDLHQHLVEMIEAPIQENNSI